MQRYFVKEKKDNQFIFNNSDIHHIKNVMRFKKGDKIEVIFKEKIYLCEITNIDLLNINILDEYYEDTEIPIDLTVAISLVNEQKFDLILQKLTELGVSKIIPIKTERSIIKLDEKKENKKLERWQMICKEASEQSHRTKIPIVDKVHKLNEITSLEYDLKLICSLSEDTKPLKEYLNDNIKSIIFVIGPEGGFTDEEEAKLINSSFNRTTLGKRVLRVETAAIYVASIINYVYKG